MQCTAEHKDYVHHEISEKDFKTSAKPDTNENSISKYLDRCSSQRGLGNCTNSYRDIKLQRLHVVQMLTLEQMHGKQVDY